MRSISLSTIRVRSRITGLCRPKCKSFCAADSSIGVHCAQNFCDLDVESPHWRTSFTSWIIFSRPLNRAATLAIPFLGSQILLRGDCRISVAYIFNLSSIERPWQGWKVKEGGSWWVGFSPIKQGKKEVPLGSRPWVGWQVDHCHWNSFPNEYDKWGVEKMNTNADPKLDFTTSKPCPLI